MRSRFDEQLMLLNKEMIEMGALCEDAIELVAKALETNNGDIYKEVRPISVEIDHKERDIEARCMKLLLQQQPVARDLRQISAALKMITDMERIGDHASDISSMVLLLAKEPYIQNLDSISKMASETVYMLIQSVEAYVEKDMKKANHVIAHDDIVDELYTRTKQDLIDLIHQDKNNGEQAADLLMVAKYFERIGDHATNIAEWVIFSLDKTPQQ